MICKRGVGEALTEISSYFTALIGMLYQHFCCQFSFARWVKENRQQKVGNNIIIALAILRAPEDNMTCV
jgi:hypothetical protein